MHFVSYGFLFFFLLVVFLYYVVPGKLKSVLLLAASLIFYGIADPRYLIFLTVTALSVWGCGILTEKNKKIAFLYPLTLILNLGILAVTKYTNFAIGTANYLWFSGDGKTPISFVNMIVPMGISFYTFQSLAYLIDVHRGVIKAEKNFLKLALFISFFPQLVQGPIGRYEEYSKTLFTPHRFDSHSVARGLLRVIWGFFKKMVIADRILIAVQALGEGPGEYPAGYVLLWMFLFTIELYMDFSGGIDITIGIAEMMGIVLAENFRRPFFSESLEEYWRRWHMTMGTWFRDYVFYPVSVSRPVTKLSKWARKTYGQKAGREIGKRIPLYIGTFLVWLCTGIWHKDSWNYVIWGLLNFAVIMISKELHPLVVKARKKHAFLDGKFFHVLDKCRTFLLVCFLNFFISSDSPAGIVQALASLFHKGDWIRMQEVSAGSLGLEWFDVCVLVVSVALVFTVGLVQETREGHIRDLLSKQPYAVKAGIVIVLILAIVLLGVYGQGYDASRFIYTQY